VTHGLVIQGHRGARGLAPENTLPGFARALDIGVTTLELDCGITRDGIVVVSHDARLNPDITRDPDGCWLGAPGPPIHSLDYDALLRYDVGRIRPGSRYARRFPHQVPTDRTPIPRLEEVFALVRARGDGRVRFNIETKVSPLEPETLPPTEFTRAVLAVVRDAGVRERVAIQSFDWRTLEVVRAEAPDVPTACLTSQEHAMDTIRAEDSSSPWTAGLHVSAFGGSVPRMVRAAGHAIWSPCFRDVARASLEEARALGLRVVVWTVNTTRDLRRMVAWGVDGIISDYPDRLVHLGKAR
jgi:glycerophosphoryl diester phosphodiesterase